VEHEFIKKNESRNRVGRAARVNGNKMPVRRLPETKLKERDGALSCAVATRQLLVLNQYA
jgi:hypothetical protein